MPAPSSANSDKTDSAGPGPPQISLPKGGGAIHGMGEKFAANPVTGTGGFTIPLATSPGRSGFGPNLALSYDSGAGNGPFGMGWTLSSPAITRKTDKGLPRYADVEESDVFILAGTEDLVPVLVQDASGDWAYEPIAPRDGYAIRSYRPRIEGPFARIERWTRQSDGDEYWRTISPDNTTTLYGATPESRICDPQDPSRVFSWLISQSQTDTGDAVAYVYLPEDAANIDLSLANERNRTDASRGANRYLSRIRYSAVQPILGTTDLTKTDWLFEVVLDYGEGYLDFPPPDAEGRVFCTATMAPAGSWPARQDPFSQYRSCFEVRTYRLCRRVLMFHHFSSELGTADCLVSATSFTYDENPVASFMTSVLHAGFARQTDGSYLQAQLPPVAFEYSPARVDKTVHEVDPESLVNLPGAIDGNTFRWLDLDGEGVQGVLVEQGDGWFYKRNITPLSLLSGPRPADGGDTDGVPPVRLEPLAEIMALPGLAQPGAPAFQFMDIRGDGRLDCMVLQRPGAGYFERGEDCGWQDFARLNAAPNVDWNDPNLRLMDVDGDGFSDILLTAEDSITYFPSWGKEGFGPPVRLPKATDEESGPAVIFADAERTVFLADMSGDGLSDIVRIRNGEVCYWPNLGYGQFGAKVTMDMAPWFDAPDLFDPARIRLADIDGSGVADIIYLASDGVAIYFNQAGNGWSAAEQVLDYPPEQTLANIEVLDLLGNGTACLVWSSSDPGDVGRSLRYIELMGRDKPYLMVRSWNNLGAETRVHYAPSTSFYLADRAAGAPWATRLAFPVHVVERVETYDWISRNRFVSRYSYHHGYFDGYEREFRGFGMVEQYDTEELGVLTGSGAFPAASNIDAASYVPPVLTRSWFHTGAYPMGPGVTRIYDGEYWAEPGLGPAEIFAMLLPDSQLDPDLTGDEIREALRALKGAPLRQEVYALDNSAAQQLPYTVSEWNYSVRRLQAFGPNRHAVFLTQPRETLDLDYERATYTIANTTVCDPRTTHKIVLEADNWGHELQSVAIAYGRRYPDTDPLMQAGDRAVQAASTLSFTQNAYTNPVLADDAYRVGVGGETRVYELTGYTPSGPAARFQASDFVASTPSGPQLVYDSEIAFEAQPTSDRQRRLIGLQRTLYRSDDLQTPLPLLTLQSLALPWASYQLALTNDQLATTFQRPQSGLPPEALVANPNAVLKGAKGGYVLGDDQVATGLFPANDPAGNWWRPSGQLFYSPGAADPPAAELANARTHFFLGRRYRDIFGADTLVDYDAHDLLCCQVTDPVGNVISAVSDYRVLEARCLTDPNGNQSSVAFDALGLPVGTAVSDHTIAGAQDSLAGFNPDLTPAEVAAFFADPRGPAAAALLGNATSRVIYDVGRYARSPSTPLTPAPNFVASILREIHVQDVAEGQSAPLQVSIAFSDGFGRQIQAKTQTDPGPLAPGGAIVPSRWIGSGWTIWNNKGAAVRGYEPFFTASQDFEYGVAVGVSSTMLYDPCGRLAAVLHPDQTWEKRVYDPWRQQAWDANDTVLVADPGADADVGPYFQRLPAADYQPGWYAQRSSGALGAVAQDAAQKARVHAGTPITSHVDPLGRTFLTLAWNRAQIGGGAPVEAQYRTFVAFDIQGHPLAITDALGRVAMTSTFDITGTLLYQSTIDSGRRWTLVDAMGKAYLGWDSRGHRLETDYDAASRPIALWVQTGSGAPVLAERTVYGEGQPGAASLNLCGKPFQQYDAGGILTNAAYDFKGNLTRTTRALRTDYADPVDWSASPVPALTGEVFATSFSFDALNRPVTLVTPDTTLTRPSYDQTGRLYAVSANPGGGGASTAFVTAITYDAKGQRQAIDYGNGASTAYAYDPETFRLTGLATTRASDGTALQALSYAYDPVGNVTHIADAAQQTVFFNNQIVDASNDYVYDALYRLIQARGREAIGLAGQPQAGWNDGPRTGQPLPLPSDTQALRLYTESYQYDAVDNILALVHAAGSGGWTRSYAYDQPNVPPTNNRLTRTSIGSAPEQPYQYDAHGNMIAMPHLSLMMWDFRNQLQATQQRIASGAPVETTLYVYDAGGQRLRKVNRTAQGAIANERIYLGAYEVYREYDSTGTVTLERQSLHVRDDSQRIALVETQTAGGGTGTPAPAVRYQFGNHLGSSALELDGGAALISYEEYYPYGSTSFQSGANAAQVSLKRYRYTGKERDAENGFYYHGARYYAPWLGRWISCDPKSIVDGINLYQYVHNNPVKNTDSTGYQTEQPMDEVTVWAPEDQCHSQRCKDHYAQSKAEPNSAGAIAGTAVASSNSQAPQSGGNGPATPLPKGMSANERVENLTLELHYPNADFTNYKQKAVDFTQGTTSTVKFSIQRKTGQFRVEETRSGGTWGQLKKLDAVAETPLINRVKAGVSEAMGKFVIQNDRPHALWRESSDGTGYKLNLQDPENLVVHIEAPGISTLSPELQQQIRNAAQETALGMQDWLPGIGITTRVVEPAAAANSANILKSLGTIFGIVAAGLGAFFTGYTVTNDVMDDNIGRAITHTAEAVPALGYFVWLGEIQFDHWRDPGFNEPRIVGGVGRSP